MLLKIDTSNPSNPLVHFYVDEGSHSCGESRSDWNKIDTVRLDSLLRSVEALASGKSQREYC